MYPFTKSVRCVKRLFKFIIITVTLSIISISLGVLPLSNLITYPYLQWVAIQDINYTLSMEDRTTFVEHHATYSQRQQTATGVLRTQAQTTTGLLRTQAQTTTRVLQTQSQTTTRVLPTRTQTTTRVLQTRTRTRKSVVQTSHKPIHTPQKGKNSHHTNPQTLELANITQFFHLSKSDPHDPYLNLHQFKYLLTANKCQHSVFLLAFVHSSSDHWKKRNQIRTTWGGDKFFNGKHFRTLFMLGKPRNESLQPILKDEALKYKDIVQGNFYDAYTNLTYKQIMAFSWITHNCPHVSYILKTDDDTMVNIYNLIQYLNKTKPVLNFCYCNGLSVHPHRHKTSKWLVTTAEYPFKHYPKYCEGFAYLITPDVAEKLLNASKSTRFYWIDDVFITGILNLKAKVPLRQINVNHNHGHMQRAYTVNHIKKLMFIVVRKTFTEKYWNSTWQAILKYSRS